MPNGMLFVGKYHSELVRFSITSFHSIFCLKIVDNDVIKGAIMEFQ